MMLISTIGSNVTKMALQRNVWPVVNTVLLLFFSHLTAGRHKTGSIATTSAREYRFIAWHERDLGNSILCYWAEIYMELYYAYGSIFAGRKDTCIPAPPPSVLQKCHIKITLGERSLVITTKCPDNRMKAGLVGLLYRKLIKRSIGDLYIWPTSKKKISRCWVRLRPKYHTHNSHFVVFGDG